MRAHASLLLLALVAGTAEPARRDAASASLAIANRPIVTFRATVVGSDPAERVRAAQQRLDALPAATLGEPITTHPLSLGPDHGVAVLVGGALVFYVVEDDVDPLAGGDRDPQRLAAEAAGRLGEALGAWRAQLTVRVLLRGLLLSAAATAALLALLWAWVRARRRALPVLSAAATRAAVALVRGRIDVGPIASAIVRTLLLVLFWAVVALLLDVWLTFVLAQFPVTAPWAAALTGQVVGILRTVGLAVIGAAPGLATAAVILLVTRFFARFLGGLFDRVERGTLTLPGVYPETASATRRMALGLVWLVGLAASYPYIPGSSSEAFKGLSLLVGLMLSLGSTGLVSQAMSGLAVIYSRALAAGDTVRVGEVEGVVSEVGLLSTKIVTVPGEEVTVPNSVVVAGAVRNFTRLSHGTGPLVTTQVTIGYDAPWRQVEGLLLGAAAATPELRRDPPPFVLQRGLADFYVQYELVARLEGDPTERPRVLSALHARIQDGFNEAGVQIMSPHFALQPREPVVVPRERWGDAPAPAPPAQRQRG